MDVTYTASPLASFYHHLATRTHQASSEAGTREFQGVPHPKGKC